MICIPMKRQQMITILFIITKQIIQFFSLKSPSYLPPIPISNVLFLYLFTVGGEALGYNNKVMEEVLRRIYKIKQRNIQRKRIEKALEGEHYLITERRKYDFREDTSINTPRTSLPFEDQIRFEKELIETRTRHFPLLSSITPQNQQFRLPVLPKKQPPKPIRRRFRAAVWAVVFLMRVQQKRKEGMLRSKRRAEKCYKNLLSFIEKLVHSYYQRQLREELTEYVRILEETVQHPGQQAEKETMQMLYYMSEKLSASSVTKDILEFFLQAATNHSFPPADFLSGMEIARLQFSPKYGCLIDISQEQTRMIVALGLGVKIFCYYLLYQPWKLGMATQTIIKNVTPLRETVNKIGSVFYYPLVEEFCLKLKEVRSLSKNLLVSFGIRAIPQLDPSGEGAKEPNTSKQLISGQSRVYLNGLELRHPELCQAIKANLTKWISRISYACLKEATRKNRRKEESAYYRTIAQKDEDKEDRKQYRSLEVTRKRKDSIGEVKRSHPLPSIKYTIQ